MSAVETIRDIPVIVEHRKNCDIEPMIVEHTSDPGFPFDNTRRSRDPLEDIAQRHPEFAQHLQGFPRRSHRPEEDENEFIRRFERPFSSGRFDRRGFPFAREDFEREPQRYHDAFPEYFQQQYPQSPDQSQQQTSSQSPPHSQQYSQTQPEYDQELQENQGSQQPQQQTRVTQGTQTETEPAEQIDAESSIPPKEEVGHTRGRPIQQSNTVDLGQKQPPDEAVNERNQRSMSAPPENKRYTSSVKIPMGGQQGQESGAKPQSQNSSSGSTERVIPIHVEGRDVPIIPKNFSSSTSQPQGQPERIFTDSPRPQPERIFGQRPEHFTQFVHRDPHSRFANDWHTSPFERGFPEEEFGFTRSGSPSRFSGQKHPQQQAPPQQQQYWQESTPQAHTSQQQKTQPQQEQKQAPAEPPQQPKPQAPKQPLGPIEQIQVIQTDVSRLLRQVESFNGVPKDKNYLYLDEMLTRNLLKLDNVDTQGQDSIRSARKEAIKCIERAISALEAKAAANVAPKQETMEVEAQTVPEVEKMETSQNTSQETQGMDVSPSPSQAAAQDGTKTNDEHDKQTVDAKSEGSVDSKSKENVENVPDQVKTEEKTTGKEVEVNTDGNKAEVKTEESKQPTESEGDANKQKEETKDAVEKTAEKQKDEVTNDNVKDAEQPQESQEGVKGQATEVKEEGKKEKKKTKKKVNKEEKEKKQ